ncbi:MAG: hypothetical protein CMH27_08615 [Micavibrio sp.]|nr:hypothetical protein [Micavibrio sp.]
MITRKAKAIALLMGSVIVYGASCGYYLHDKNIILSDYVSSATFFAEKGSKPGHSETQHAENPATPTPLMPAIDVTEFSWPELPDITLSWPELPQFDSWTMPEVSMPDVTLPPISWPEIKLPEFSWPEFSWENTAFDAPLYKPDTETIKRRGTDLPLPSLPNIHSIKFYSIPELPKVQVQDWIKIPSLPEVEWPDITMPTVSVPEIPDINIDGIKQAALKPFSFISAIPDYLYDLGQSIKNHVLALQSYAAQSIENIVASFKWPDLPLPTLPVANASAITMIEPAAGDEGNFKTTQVDNERVLFQDDRPSSSGKSENKKEKPEENPGPTPEAEAQVQHYKYNIEDNELNIEGVLVPQKATVISSSKDGKIAAIHFENGDMFRKGDILVEYECKDLKAEMEIAEAEKDFTQKRTMRHEKLLNLDIISDIEHLGIKTEDIKAEGQAKIIESKLEQCYIRAAYDGRVTNRLANPHEYTRSDRVLMEVASLDDLEIEFLVPSRWLRWVNVGAPLTLSITETGETYEAKIERIHGEVDPVSQSIQMSAKLSPYTTPLLPGMSGNVHLNIAAIRNAGIKGFLEEPRYSSNDRIPANSP